MYEVFRIKFSKPNLKISQKPYWFWKTPKNLGFKEWNAWKWGIRDIPSEEKLDWAQESLEKEVWKEREWVGRWKDTSVEREIEEKWEENREEPIYRTSVNLDRCRCREVSSHVSRLVSRNKSSTVADVEHVSRNKPSDTRTEARSINLVYIWS